ncbi:hypothetical protein HanPI659440_Chr02g0039641 [Helianthus annuus]|nr:hypothetical protein HanPI659440_Chr02g0039641 [Helianthus annuus]
MNIWSYFVIFSSLFPPLPLLNETREQSVNPQICTTSELNTQILPNSDRVAGKKNLVDRQSSRASFNGQFHRPNQRRHTTTYSPELRPPENPPIQSSLNNRLRTVDQNSKVLWKHLFWRSEAKQNKRLWRNYGKLLMK